MARPTPQEIQDIRDQAKIDAAYEKSLRTMTLAPASAPATTASSTVKKAKGGVTRADGCITKGHTKGRMV